MGKKKFLVTGAAGFIGSNLCEHLIKEGHQVSGLDNFSTGRRENLKGISRDFEAFFAADVRDLERCKEAVRGVDCVLHLAALGSVARSVDDPLATHQNNVDGTLAMLRAALAFGVERFVLASSSSVYGGRGPGRLSERDLPSPRSPYAASKVAGESYCQAFRATYGMTAVALRYFNVFGPRQSPEGPYAAVVPRFLRACLQGEPLVIHGDGEQARDFTYVSNVVEANLRVCLSAAPPPEVLNVGCGEATSINKLAELLRSLTLSSSPIQHDDARAGEVRWSCADPELGRTVLGDAPPVSLLEGLERLVRRGG